MSEIQTQNRTKLASNVREMTKIALFTAMLAVMSQISVPLPGGVPVSLQTFAVCLCGYFLGKKSSVISVLVYIALGICGAPVFAGFSGGIQRLLGGTGGFIIGFIFLALLCALGIRKDNKKTNAAVAVLCGCAGIAVVHLFGVLWFAHVTGKGLLASFLAASAGFIVKDVLSCAVAYIVYLAAPKALKSK